MILQLFETFGGSEGRRDTATGTGPVAAKDPAPGVDRRIATWYDATDLDASLQELRAAAG